MRLNTQQRIALGVLALGVGALVVDKLLLGGPSSASAAPAVVSSGAHGGVSGPAGVAAGGRPDGRREALPIAAELAERFDAAGVGLVASVGAGLGAGPGVWPDGFGVTGTWLEPRAEAEPAEVIVEPARRVEVPRVEVTTVLREGHGGAAVLNGVTLRVGETGPVPGAPSEVTLVAVEDDGRSVRLVMDGIEWVVSAMTPGG